MMLLIRADASPQIGTGHVMRCLALAQAWQYRGGQVVFVTHETLSSSLKQRLKTEGITIHSLPPILSNHDDALEVIALAQKTRASVIVVDGYQFDAVYQQALKAQGLRLLFLDDYGHASHYSADWVLNQNLYATGKPYISREAYTQLLLGVRYFLLRREFQAWIDRSSVISEYVCKVLVTMGGSDPDNMTSQVLEVLNHIDGSTLDVTVVVGDSNPYLQDVQKSIQQSRHTVHLKESVSNIPELMAWADLAIAASGSTAWELVFMGTPAIVLPIVDNQKPIAEILTDMSVVLKSTIDDLVQDFNSLASNKQRRIEMRHLQRFLIDGKGAVRVCEILNQQEERLMVRPATLEDTGLIWRWSNDPVTRSNSFNKKSIPWSDHVNWYQKKLASNDCRIWLLEHNGIPVAHIRYERLDRSRALISFMVDPEQRAKGFGTKILQMTHLLAFQALDVTMLEGETFSYNIGSIRAFEKAGFTKTDSHISSDQSVFIFQFEMK